MSRYKSAAENAEKIEDELKAEKRKLQREVNFLGCLQGNDGLAGSRRSVMAPQKVPGLVVPSHPDALSHRPREPGAQSGVSW